MELWTFLTIVVLAGCALQGYRAYVNSRGARPAELDEIEARLEALEGDASLEERVRALEAIVTDPRFQLDSEIDRLKD